MKCDVCGTKIPLGADECPNCGYNVRKVNVQSFDASGDSHNHIRSHSIPAFHETKLNDIKVKSRRNTLSKKQSFSGLKMIFVVILIMFIVGMVAIPVFISKISDIPDIFTELTQEDISNQSFQEIIDNGYDDQGTVQLAMDEKERLVIFLQDKLQLINITTNEYCDKYGDTIYASFSVEGTYQDTQYKISGSADSGNLAGYDLNISGMSEKSIREMNQLPIDKTVTNEIGNYIGVEYMYQFINGACSKMELDEDSDDRYVYVSDDFPYLYLSESQFSDGYQFYCSVSK